MIARRTLLGGGLAALATPTFARSRPPRATVSVLVDLSETWHNPRDDRRNLRLLAIVGRALAGAAKALPKPVMVRYHAIGRDSLGQEALCETSYNRSMFGTPPGPGEIGNERDFTAYVADQCPRFLLRQPVQPATEIRAAIIEAMKATAMADRDAPKLLIILSDFKEESAVPYSLRTVPLRGVRTVLLYRVLPEFRRDPSGLEARIHAWKKELTGRQARVVAFEDTAVTAADLQAQLENMA